MKPTKPEGYEDEFGGYRAVLFDGWCDEPIAWGFPLTRHLEEERFQSLRKAHEVVYIRDGMSRGSWVVVTSRLTHADAIEEYGAIADLELGPRGGWRSITYGKRKFCAKLPGVQEYVEAHR